MSTDRLDRAEARADAWVKQQQQETSAPPAATWPKLAGEALHGPIGELVETISPHTEADPVAILVQALVAFGSVIGRGPHFRVGSKTRHGTNLYAVLIGETSKARKGTSAQDVLGLFEAIEPEWATDCVASGLSSGEGLIYAIRDPVEKREAVKERGRVTDYQTVITDHGIKDKRLLVIEEEFSSPLKVMKRDGNTLSPVLRSGWDGRNLRTLTKTSPTRSTEPHVSIIGHVTKDELLRHLTEAEVANGFGNRFLWLLVRRSNCLPWGGDLGPEDLALIAKQFAAAVDHARTLGRIEPDGEARKLWEAVYPDLAEAKPGLLGAMIARAEPQAMRLALLYALADRATEIRHEHLVAALALWDYAEASTRYIFGDSLGDPVADEILGALRAAGPDGLTRTDLREHFGRHKRSEEIDRALRVLADQRLASCTRIATGGRPAEVWTLRAISAVSAVTGAGEDAE